MRNHLKVRKTESSLQTDPSAPTEEEINEIRIALCDRLPNQERVIVDSLFTQGKSEQQIREACIAPVLRLNPVSVNLAIQENYAMKHLERKVENIAISVRKTLTRVLVAAGIAALSLQSILDSPVPAKVSPVEYDMYPLERIEYKDGSQLATLFYDFDGDNNKKVIYTYSFEDIESPERD